MVHFTVSRPSEQGLWIKKLIAHSRIKRKILSHILVVRVALIALVFVAFIGLGAIFVNPLSRVLSNLLFVPKIGFAFLLGSPQQLDHTGTRTNILVMGIGGEGHDAPNLTDTILFVSMPHAGQKPVILSLPRDIWIPSLGAKLNSAYAVGKVKRKDGGLQLAKASVNEILDQPVHYGLVIDFGGFKKIIDDLGGIEVAVDRSFDDPQYPIAGKENDTCGGDLQYECRYELVHFEQGSQIMNGDQALKFVRSRHALGDEGTDFARAARQQKVIIAIRQKIISKEVLLNPQKILSLWQILNGSVDRDIPAQQLAILARMFLTMDKKKLDAVILDGSVPGDAQTGLLLHPTTSSQYNNEWVLVPRDTNFGEIKTWVKQLLED